MQFATATRVYVEEPKTIHIFWLPYSATVYGALYLNYTITSAASIFQIDTSTPDWHLKCQRQDCFAFVSNTMIKYKRFWGDGQSVCHPGWPVYHPGYQGTVVREICPRWKFFRLLATARLMAQRYWEGLTSLQRKWISQYGRPNFRHNCQIGANWRGAPIINFRPLCGRNWRTLLLIVGPAK